MIKNIVTPANDAGRFSNGDPTKGIPGTVVTAEFLNGLIDALGSISEELKFILKEAKIEESEGLLLLKALGEIFLRKDAAPKIVAASTEVAGIVKLNDTANSNSVTEAATANAVRKAYELANTAIDKAIKLNDTVSSTSTTEAATARALKQTYDLATSINNKINPAFGVAQNGYFIYPPDVNGRRMIIQWGIGGPAVVFPIAFTTQVFQIVASSALDGGTAVIRATFYTNNISNTGFSVGVSARWIAVGY